MTVLDPIGAAPETRTPRFLLLLAGASLAPIFWMGQVMLGYGVTAFACYPGDHPVMPASAALLRALLFAFDATALIACIAGGWISWRCWQRCPSGSRSHFLALWGLMSSLWFFGAILFNIIASVTVPPCLE